MPDVAENHVQIVTSRTPVKIRVHSVDSPSVSRRRLRIVTSINNESPTKVRVHSVNNLTRLSANSADWSVLNEQIRKNAENISNLQEKTNNLEDSLNDVSGTVNQLSYLLDKDLLTFEEIGA